MQLDYFKEEQFNNMELLEILKEIISSFGTPVSKNDFKKELENIKKINTDKIAQLLNEHIEKIITNEAKEIKQYIFAEVIKINSNGTIDVKKTEDIDFNHSWTEIPNPTIFKYLEKGDRVLIGCSKRNQKSSCWVEFADILPSQINQKTILKDINKIFDLSSNIELLKYWIEEIDKEL